MVHFRQMQKPEFDKLSVAEKNKYSRIPESDFDKSDKIQFEKNIGNKRKVFESGVAGSGAAIPMRVPARRTLGAGKDPGLEVGLCGGEQFLPRLQALDGKQLQ